MILGDYIYYRCPNCGAYMCIRGVISCNTLGAFYFSDGNMSAPMMPNYPDITKCERCNGILKLSDLKQLGEKEGRTVDRTGACLCRHLEILDLYRALGLFKEDELGIRLEIWRTYNSGRNPDVRPEFAKI